jgi:hypothetical protein
MQKSIIQCFRKNYPYSLNGCCHVPSFFFILERAQLYHLLTRQTLTKSSMTRHIKSPIN